MVRQAMHPDEHYIVDELFRDALGKGIPEAQVPERMRMMVHAKRAGGLYVSSVVGVLVHFTKGLALVYTDGDRGMDFAGLARLICAADILLRLDPELFPWPGKGELPLGG